MSRAPEHEPVFQFYRDEVCDAEQELTHLLHSASRIRIAVASLCGEVSELVKYPDDYAYDTLQGRWRLLRIAKRQPEVFIVVCHHLDRLASWTFMMVGAGAMDEEELTRRAASFLRRVS